MAYMPLRLGFHRRGNEARHQGREGDCRLRLPWAAKAGAWTGVLFCRVGDMSML